MDPEDLQGRYQHLREELDAAYAAPHWNSERIDQIAEQMLPLERALATRHAPRQGGERTAARA